MSGRYFFVVKFLPDYADTSLLCGRCISIMHGFINKNPTGKNAVGVSFPFWTEESLGNAIAFVAEDKELLIGLSFQPYFSLMKEEGLFELSAVLPVADDAKEVRFIRNQAIGKSFLGSKRRRMKRAQDRAEKLGNIQPNKVNEDRVFDNFHRIPLSSQSTNQDIMLHVQKEGCVDIRLNHFNSYGLATNQAWKGTVPDLKNTMF
ncbi:type I-F CRISPR-associated endoribonuclease Cas6/Csy4 [Vibrio casei]|uniref:type I-F CRISPR-associated endoribonuclease Cas6/Csy4 n=1 Tax=Vibrio casei TaxID=673372 RepID=UPI003F9CC495